MDNFEEIYSDELLWGTPIDYKGVKLYPVSCADIIPFYRNVYPLLYDPLRYNSLISTLPRLYFLTDILNKQTDRQYFEQNSILVQLYFQLCNLLKLVMKEQKTDFINNNGKWYLQVITENGTVIPIRAKDFENIRKIILYQNGVEFDDTFVHEDIRQWINEQESADKAAPVTIEDKMEAYMLQMCDCDTEKFKTVSLRRFNRIVDKLISRENYNIKMTASMSGFVTFKEKIDHWISVDRKNSIYSKYFKELK